jgi:CdiI immunity protein
MTNKISHQAMPSPGRSELQQLASWFHQDWKMVFPDFYKGLNLYLDNLPQERRVALGRELRQFLEQNNGRSSEELKQLWLRLGAQGWQASLDIHSALEEFCRVIQQSSKTQPG